MPIFSRSVRSREGFLFLYWCLNFVPIFFGRETRGDEEERVMRMKKKKKKMRGKGKKGYFANLELAEVERDQMKRGRLQEEGRKRKM